MLRVLRSKWLSMGPEVEALESELASFLGVRHVVAVSSGTAALHLAHLAIGIGPGDEVIHPAVTFVAAANTTVAVGARPIFADIVGIHEPTIDPVCVEAAITERTKAVAVMHYGGYSCRLAEIVNICRRHGLALIEDACHAIGGRYRDRLSRPPHGASSGTVGDVGCYSFFSNKNMATGEGGAVVTNRDDVATMLRRLRSHGMTTLTWDRHRGHASAYDVVAHGWNYRLDELHAALGRCQLHKLLDNNSRRRVLVDAYREATSDLDGWIMPFADHPGESAYHLSVLVAPDAPIRHRVVTALKTAGIQTSMHYPCITDFTAFRAYDTGRLNRSHDFASRAMTVPLFPTMTLDQLGDVCRAVGAATQQETPQ